MCASVGRSLDNDNNNTIGLFSAFHGPPKRFREQTCKVVVVENHVTHRLSSSFHSTLTKTPSSLIAHAEKNVWRRHCFRIWGLAYDTPRTFADVVFDISVNVRPEESLTGQAQAPKLSLMAGGVVHEIG